MTPHPALTSYIRSHSGGLALPVAIISLGTPEEDGNHFTSNASQWKTTRVALCNHSWGLEMIVAFRNHLAPYLPCNHFLGSSVRATPVSQLSLSLACLLACLGYGDGVPWPGGLPPRSAMVRTRGPFRSGHMSFPSMCFSTPDPNRHPS